LAKSLQLHNSPVDCARELFKPSKDFVSVSLLLCNEKSFFAADEAMPNSTHTLHKNHIPGKNKHVGEKHRVA